MIGLNDYQEGFVGGQGGDELLKAMQAGQITGRDTTGLALGQEPLKAESLDKTLKILETRMQDIKLWNLMPKQVSYNTVEEYVQLASYGQQVGGFYGEGQLSNVQDSKYIRKAELIKYMQVTGEVTMQAQMVKSFVDAMQKEVANKTMWIARLANKSLVHANSHVVPEEFNSIYAQHADIGNTNGSTYASFEQYYNGGVVIDLRGKSLKQTNVEDGAVAVDANFGNVAELCAPTTVLSALAKDYYATQRILMNGGFGGDINSVPKVLTTTIGDVKLIADKFMKQNPSKNSATPTDSPQAPAAPTVSNAAVAASALSKYVLAEAGNVYYAVAAVNNFGESPLAIYGTAPATLAAGYGVDISFTAGNGAYPATGYVIYRTKVTTAGSAAGLEFYPIFKVSETDRANGYNGAAAGTVRDLGYFLPDTEQCFLTEIVDDIVTWKQLAPLSKLDLAIISMSRRFITFMFGTPQLFAPKKIVRYINVGKVYTA